ncbi:MAG: GDSL-type esterase/lipase family protein [Verrucomicrobiota bacterium]
MSSANPSPLFPRRVRVGLRGLLALAIFSFGIGLAHAGDGWAGAIDKLTAGDAAHPPAEGGIVFTGSSTITGWNAKLARDFPGLPVIGRGFGGSTIADGLRHLDRIVLPYRPRLVVFYAGENDIAAGVSPEEVAARFAAYSDAVLTALPGARLLYIGIKPSPMRWSMQAKFDRANALIADHCARTPRAVFLDIKPVMLDADGLPRPELFLPDDLHLNAEGYRVWRELLAPLLVSTTP